MSDIDALNEAYNAAMSGAFEPDSIIANRNLLAPEVLAKIEEFEAANPGIEWTMDLGTGVVRAAPNESVIDPKDVL